MVDRVPVDGRIGQLQTDLVEQKANRHHQRSYDRPREEHRAVAPHGAPSFGVGDLGIGRIALFPPNDQTRRDHQSGHANGEFAPPHSPGGMVFL